jgi:hypothetical protein
VVPHEGSDVLLTGSSDRTIQINQIGPSGDLTKLLNIPVDNGDMSNPRSLDLLNGKLLVGFSNGSIG